tara:strand:- start:65 stop:331 length:267 start_codon:yes stop_codon:yes gene_type:complete
MANQHYTLWVKTHCPFCIKAKDELYRRKLDHTVYVMDDRPDDLNTTKQVLNHPTVPIIVLQENDKEKLIGGYTDLLMWLTEQSEGQSD